MSSFTSEEEEEEEAPTAMFITEEVIQKAIDELLPTVELATTSVKEFRTLVSQHLEGADLSDHTSFIRKALTEAINKNEESEEEESDDEKDEQVPQKKKTVSKGGYNAPKELSPKLAKFLNERELSRPQIVKALWDYIKAHNLQNPENKKEILLDPKMKKVFGCDAFDMFSMSKYISAHCHPFPPLDLTKKAAKTKTASSRTKRKAASSSSSSDKPTKKRATGTQPPWRLSDAMVNVLGVEALPRPQVVSKLWEYIKGHDLQNPNNRKEILCDDKLKAIFDNKKKVDMFSMNKLITKHLLEKVDRS